MGGITRLVASATQPEYRVVLILSGVVSTVLGLMVLFNLFSASFVLLGVLLGVETLMDGIAMMLMGQVHVSPASLPGPRVAHP